MSAQRRRPGFAAIDAAFGEQATLQPAQAEATLQQVAHAGGELQVDPSSLRPSPFQPVGRPSPAAITAVRAALDAAGSWDTLLGASEAEGPEAGAEAASAHRVTPEHPAFRALDAESRALAQLAGNVAATGKVDVALEVRETDAGLELISGHRRQAAAILAGRATVPVRSLGRLDDARAAELVFRHNRLREDFTPWQEAVSLLELQRRRENAVPGSGSVRQLARVMGYSIGRVNELLAFARDVAPPALRSELGGGDARAVEASLARLAYADLRKLLQRQRSGVDSSEMGLAISAAVARRGRPLASAQPTAAGDADGGHDGESASAEDARPTPLAIDRVNRRGGGYTLTVLAPIDALDEASARALLEQLRLDMTAVRRRLRHLAAGAAGDGEPNNDAHASSDRLSNDRPPEAPASVSARRPTAHDTTDSGVVHPAGADGAQEK
jgi:ParB family chromosome partitioning protein